jgi:H/ACA ribonucleoprotein complex subunit 4
VQKFGRANENTPAKWNASYKDFNRTDDGSSLPVAQTTSTAEVLAAPAIPPVGISSAQQAEAEAGAAMDVDTKSSKKRKSRDDDDEEETTEDKAERKRKKKEEKEKKRADKAAKKEKRKSKGGDDEDSD